MKDLHLNRSGSSVVMDLSEKLRPGYIHNGDFSEKGYVMKIQWFTNLFILDSKGN